MMTGDDEQDAAAPLLPPAHTAHLQQRWQEIQAGFVDEPRQMVEQADALVAEVMQQLAVAVADAANILRGNGHPAMRPPRSVQRGGGLAGLVAELLLYGS